MTARVKNFIRSFFPRQFDALANTEMVQIHGSLSFSQEGEDILFKRLFQHSSRGFYVDIGAHHPFRFSNTKLLYDKGWNGLNIEPNPDVHSLFERYRHRDINLSMGVGSETDTLTYYRFHHPAFNTFLSDVAQTRNTPPEVTEKIKVRPLRDILCDYLPRETSIDLLNVDAEGMDLEILKSNDWSKFPAEWILVETDALSVQDVLKDPLNLYLDSIGYVLVSKLWKSLLFKKTR